MWQSDGGEGGTGAGGGGGGGINGWADGLTGDGQGSSVGGFLVRGGGSCSSSSIFRRSLPCRIYSRVFLSGSPSLSIPPFLS